MKGSDSAGQDYFGPIEEQGEVGNELILSLDFLYKASCDHQSKFLMLFSGFHLRLALISVICVERQQP